MQLSQIDIKEQKKAARSHFIELRKNISDEKREAAGLLICQNVLKLLSQFDGIETVLMFYPLRRELAILPLFDMLKSMGICVAFPISHVEEVRLEFKTVTSLSDMVDGAHGIKEPPRFEQTLSNFDNCLCIVPALAFDSKGMRIGYGKGYYDRFLQSFTGVCAGVALSDFLVDKLPCESTDQAIDVIITEGEIFIQNEQIKSLFKK